MPTFPASFIEFSSNFLDFVEGKLLGKVLVRGAAKPRKLKMSESKIWLCALSIPLLIPSALGLFVNLGRIRQFGAVSS